MFRAHSLLWHYLWVAPNILLLILAFLMWSRGLAKQVPAFFAFATFGALSELSIYTADVCSRIGPWTFWSIDWGALIIQGLLKFILIGEIFAHVFGTYESIARLGRLLIRALGVVLMLTAAIAAAYAPQNSHFGIISGAWLLEQTIFIVESGLLVFIFVFSFYFHLTWDRRLLGITLGLSISSCVHLASWAVLNLRLPDSQRIILDFLNMATYHAVVLMWFYYLLVPGKNKETPTPPKPPTPLPENDLGLWNRELERLIHQ